MPSQTFFNLPVEKREVLIDIALDEFSSHDYSSASVSRLVRKAGIAKGSFYQYFEDKKDLYVYLLKLLSEAKAALLRETSPSQAEMDFYEYLSWLFEVNIHFDRTHPVLSKLAYRAFYGNSSLQDPAIAEIERASTVFIRQIVIQGIERGDINSDLDRDLVVFTVETLIDAFNNYLPTMMGVTADGLAESGASDFDLEAAQEKFEQLIQILKLGLANNSNINHK